MKHTPKTVFIKSQNTYVEITNEEHERRKKLDEQYKSKKFILLHGALVEVDELFHKAFYKTKGHEEYLQWRTANKEILYDSYDTDEMLGEDMLIADFIDIDEQIDLKIMSEKIHSFLQTLSDKDREVIIALFFNEQTERELAKQMGVSQVAIHKRKVRVLEKLKNFLKK